MDDTTLAEEVQICVLASPTTVQVYRMASDKKETRENRRLAQKVVEEWCEESVCHLVTTCRYRKISGSSTNQRELARVDEERFREEPVEPRCSTFWRHC